MAGRVDDVVVADVSVVVVAVVAVVDVDDVVVATVAVVVVASWVWETHPKASITASKAIVLIFRI
jgi:hypothetical protein